MAWHLRARLPVPLVVFGVLHVILGVVSVATLPVPLLTLIQGLLAPEDPIIAVSASHRLALHVIGVLRLVLPFATLASGVALLRGRRRGVLFAFLWGALSVVELVVSAQLDWSTIIAPLLDHVELRDPGAAPNLAESVGPLVGRGLFLLAYVPLALRFLVFDRSVRAYFGAASVRQ